MTSLIYLLGPNPVLYFVVYFLTLWNRNFKCVTQNACAVYAEVWGIKLAGFSSLSLKVAVVYKMKVAYLSAFKFNLTSCGLKMLSNKPAVENWWLGQLKVNKVKFFLPFQNFIKRLQTKFHTDTWATPKLLGQKSQFIIRSKIFFFVINISQVTTTGFGMFLQI